MRTTPKKLAACDPCRAAKLACDHLKPTCTRCRDGKREVECTYRQMPFKKRRKLQLADVVQSPKPKLLPSSPDTSIRPSAVGTPTLRPHSYPNPGYLGPFSHTALFNDVSGVEEPGSTGSTPSSFDPHTRPEGEIPEENVIRGAKVVEQIAKLLSSTCENLVQTWLGRGANLALAWPFAESCLKTLQYMFHSRSGSRLDTMIISRCVFRHSCEPLLAESTATIEDFSAQFCYKSARWETLGLVCILISRAATDSPGFSSGLASDYERRDLQRQGMDLADRCLDMALSLDCLNELQLIFQFENFILHSLVDGDQSYQSWKRLGDVISSLSALGYHQQVGSYPTTPKFLIELRQAAFALSYSADMNVSIFLGRPPRISRKYCRFRLPGDDDLDPPAQDKIFNYTADAAWSARCAILKEDILDCFETKEGEERQRVARLIKMQAREQWVALPAHFRLESPLKLCDRHPVVRDFMVSARLNYLHVLFLLHLALSRHNPQSDPELVDISSQILSLIVETIMQKHHLVNSGVSLVWKVAYYGLSAAGVICLWLPVQLSTMQSSDVDLSKVVQNLSVLVAEMETGTLIRAHDPNYKLLSSASHTIGSLLNRILSGKLSTIPNFQAPPSSSTPLLGTVDQSASWSAWESHALQDFESDFWTNLADHPFLHEP
ncbi:putative Zn(II)2Cys6 transcription factor [Xylariales sp. PMI_506]|nr:putative Zn(II)2Cys6 transcription factor [Xylariales sp. PMI_506]